MTMDEKRKKSRNRVDQCKGKFFQGGLLSMLGLGTYYEFKAIDYCPDGMKVSSQTPIRISEQYTFSIPDASGRMIKVPGKIKWAQLVETADTDNKKSAWLAGIEFGKLSYAVQTQLEAAMKVYIRKDMTVRKARVKRYYGKGGGD